MRLFLTRDRPSVRLRILQTGGGCLYVPLGFVAAVPVSSLPQAIPTMLFARQAGTRMAMYINE
jgi:hypothetical protein